MNHTMGTYRETTAGGETVRAFIPDPLPPSDPPLDIDEDLAEMHTAAVAALRQLEVAGTMVPNDQWFLYGFARKEAVLSSRIEGTQATIEDVVAYEATRRADNSVDVEEVCNYVDALDYARSEISDPEGLPISTRLLCATHAHLMAGTRGSEKQPGEVRSSQNWIGGTRPGNAFFVPPPPDVVPEALGHLERWIHSDDPLPPLVRAGLAHAQFETIHPFLDGNGRVGRLLINLLIEHWDLLSASLLYLSVAFRRHQEEYYHRLNAVRTDGDWEGWTRFFLDCVREAARDGVGTARRLFRTIDRDRRRLLNRSDSTMTTMNLFEQLPNHPVLTVSQAMELTETSKPTSGKAVECLCEAGMLKEITGRQRGRAYAYRDYLNALSDDPREQTDDDWSDASSGNTTASFPNALRRLNGTESDT